MTYLYSFFVHLFERCLVDLLSERDADKTGMLHCRICEIKSTV